MLYNLKFFHVWKFIWHERFTYSMLPVTDLPIFLNRITISFHLFVVISSMSSTRQNMSEHSRKPVFKIQNPYSEKTRILAYFTQWSFISQFPGRQLHVQS